MSSKLTPKQRRFVQELMLDENAKQAAIRAGYSPRTAETTGPYLTRQPHIKAAIEEARKEVAERMRLRQDQVIAELKRLMFLDPRKAFDGEGRLLPVHRMPEDVARAVAGMDVEVEEEPERQADDGFVVKARARAAVKKVLWSSKVKALELGMRHLGMLDKKKDGDGPGEGVTVNINLEGGERGR